MIIGVSMISECHTLGKTFVFIDFNLVKTFFFMKHFSVQILKWK